jgi:hypothetical protein
VDNELAEGFVGYGQFCRSSVNTEQFGSATKLPTSGLDTQQFPGEAAF